jgi:hypothetical protein
VSIGAVTLVRCGPRLAGRAVSLSRAHAARPGERPLTDRRRRASARRRSGRRSPCAPPRRPSRPSRSRTPHRSPPRSRPSRQRNGERKQLPGGPGGGVKHPATGRPGAQRGETKRHAEHRQSVNRCCQLAVPAAVVKAVRQRRGRERDRRHEHQQQQGDEHRHLVDTRDVGQPGVVVNPDDPDHEEADRIGGERRPGTGELGRERALHAGPAGGVPAGL